MKIEWTRFTNYFASVRAAKFGVFFITLGTTFLLPLDSAGAIQVSNVQVICANPQGEQRTFTIGWDNSQTFFQGRGQISRLFCEGGYAGNYRTFISNNLNDSTLDWYQGILPVLPVPVVPDSPTVTAESTTATQESAPQNTETVTAQTPSETSTSQSASTTQDSATVNQVESSTPSVQDSPTSTVDSPTAIVDSQPSNNSDSQTAQIVPPVSDSSTVTAPVEPSLPIPDSSSPVQETATVTVAVAPQAPSTSPIAPSPTPAPTVSEPIAVVPAPVATPPEPAPSPEISPPALEPVQPPAPEPAQPAPVEPEPAPSIEPDPAPVPEPAPSVEAVEPAPIPAPTTDPIPAAPIPVPVNSDPSPAPVSINSVDVATLPPDTPVELENGVVLKAEVVVALILLENPAELLGAIFTDPAQALMALSNIGADMSPQVREQSEKVVISAIIAGGIATQAASIAAASTYRRKP